MAKKNNKICIACGKAYEFCNSCEQYDHLPRWMNIVHNENCRKLLYIAADYNIGKINAEQAREAFKDCDLSYKDKLDSSILDVVNIAMPKKNKKTQEMPEASEAVIEE